MPSRFLVFFSFAFIFSSFVSVSLSETNKITSLPTFEMLEFSKRRSEGHNFINTLKKGEVANLRGQNLQREMLAGVRLTKADLNGVNLSGAMLAGADLSQADLANADLERAMLLGADLRGTNLVNANLEGAMLLGAHLEGARIDGANLKDSNVNQEQINEACEGSSCRSNKG
jgi:uncharacterized protein YjbI with pentapeptide repeats